MKLPSLYTNLRASLLLVPWLGYLFVADLLLSLLLPISFVLPKTAYNVSSHIAYAVWLGIQKIFTKANGAHITKSGDKLPRGESAFVVANHISWTDFYMIQDLALDSGMLGRCRWFAKQQLKWVPFLGWGLWAMGMPLISRAWDKDERELLRVFRGPKQYGLPIWLIAYSESTRYTPQKYLSTIQWCQLNSKPTPKYTLWPRTRGFTATVRALREPPSTVTAIYDLTIAYAHGTTFFEAPSMWETLANPRLKDQWKFHVHVRRFAIEEFRGLSEKELAKWLEDRWVEKGRVLEGLQRRLEEGKDWEGFVGEEKDRDAKKLR
ncbi:putative 1-acyl-sn-glycerol-3-phosphate acyltransferase [Phaeomoniella chlamydospora]|uniref:Putative 1-acyl-sn-glycerol-3-phosphate acyltransferase n=1 Tax=Phaeomoniella chlamydospora TaxID=158046 RepID=A0A0G2GKW8_PHACM|nr:putative 1-acyl-sn-glycerol-3-phosphate acyltransferase [Phaeomoniella chlamydospora]